MNAMTETKKMGCSTPQLMLILQEIENQPAWRTQADKEADYIDGNQLDNEKLQDQVSKGIAPLIENVMGRVVNDIRGIEAKNHTDLKAIAEDMKANIDVVDAVNQKLAKAERESGADRAVTLAHAKQIGVGLGWAEVAREPNPFKFPYRVSEIHRNEIWWDMRSREPDLSDAMWLLRKKWSNVEAVVSQFKGKEQMIRAASSTSTNFDELTFVSDGGGETGLGQSLDITRGWTIEESEWRDFETNRVCLIEVYTRHHRTAIVFKLQDGRILEYDKKDELHRQAVLSGVQLVKATVSDIYKTFFLGPHVLHEEKVKTTTGRFPYIPFFGEREDRTGIPFGSARSLMSQQDELNSRNSQLFWGLGAVRTKRTEGAVAMSDADFRQMIGRRDADIVLDEKAMRTGGIFEVERDFNANSQQFERLNDIRNSMHTVSGVSESFQGQGGSNQTSSGLSMQIEQSQQSLATITDNLRYARMMLGDALIEMIIEDFEDDEDVLIEGNILKDDRWVKINASTVDEATGKAYKTNDVQRVKITMSLADVPSTPSYRQQALSALTEFAKSSSPAIQQILSPHIAALAEVPNREEIVEAIRNAEHAPTEEEIEQQIKDAVDQALMKAQTALKEQEIALKTRELDIKEDVGIAQIQKMLAETVNKAIESIYSATQAGREIAATPQIAGVADQILGSAGFEDSDLPPVIVTPDAMVSELSPEPAQNTSPMFPPRVQEPDLEMAAMEEDAALENPGVGMQEGIEA